MDDFDFDACVSRIRGGWTVGRTCRIVARGLAARVRHAERLYKRGHMPLERAVKIAYEAEAVSFSFGPLPRPGKRNVPVRGLLVAAALASITAPAAGRDWPTAPDRWRYDVQARDGRYSTVEAVPAGSAHWDVTVTCGRQGPRGRVLSTIVGHGRGEFGRAAGMGGAYQVAGEPGPGFSYVIDLPGDELDVPSQFTDPRCASGRGQLSSGD